MSRDMPKKVPAGIEHLRSAILTVLRDIISGKIVLLFGSTRGSLLLRQYLIDAGASEVFDLPSAPKKACQSISAQFHFYDEELLRPSEHLRAHLIRLDPQRRAVVYAGSFVSTNALDGRPVLGRRAHQWRESEKKKYQCILTSGQDNYTPQYLDLTSGLTPDDFLQYCRRTLPCVVSGDANGCIAMGADYVYVFQEATPAEMMERIARLLFQQCEGVRVAPLSQGLPATYYGVVSGYQQVLYGPVEALVGVQLTDCRVVAPGILIPAAISESVLEDAAANVGELVAKLVTATGYRGTFGIDGSFSRSAFIVHEINPRLCAGFSLISRLFDDQIPFGLIDLIVREAGIERCRTVFALLQASAERLRLGIDVKLWNDASLEESLRQQIPSIHTKADLERWRILVRRSALAGNAPLYSP